MAICGHYIPAMTHTHASECSLCSSRAAAVGYGATLPPRPQQPPPLVVVPYCGCCYWCLFSHSSPLKHTALTHQCACSHARRCLSARKMGEIHTHTSTRVHMPNMDSLMEDPLTLFLLTEYILFILVQSPALTPHRFYSAPSISLCLSALSLVYQPVSGSCCGLDHCG